MDFSTIYQKAKEFVNITATEAILLAGAILVGGWQLSINDVVFVDKLFSSFQENLEGITDTKYNSMSVRTKIFEMRSATTNEIIAVFDLAPNLDYQFLGGFGDFLSDKMEETVNNGAMESFKYANYKVEQISERVPGVTYQLYITNTSKPLTPVEIITDPPANIKTRVYLTDPKKTTAIGESTMSQKTVIITNKEASY